MPARKLHLLTGSRGYRAAAPGHVADQAAGAIRVVALVDVGVAVERDVDPVPAEQTFQTVRTVKEGVRRLGRVGRVEREVEGRELDLRRMGGEVVLEPLVLRAAGCPVVVEVVLIEAARAEVGVRPGGVQHVEPRGPRVETRTRRSGNSPRPSRSDSSSCRSESAQRSRRPPRHPAR